MSGGAAAAHACSLLHALLLPSFSLQAKELEARRAALGKWKLDLLHKTMDALDLQRGAGDKVGWCV